ncbi:hypothetical protein DV737_g4391, partial [Chaetothyriales sp. CBS 132003]
MSQPPSHMQDLAQQISAATSILTNFLSSNGLVEPSFRADARLDVPSMPEDVEAARGNLREAAQELYILATYPSDLRWLYHFKIASFVPLEGARSFSDVAKDAGVDEGHLRRMLREAMTNRIFCEPRAGFVAHTAASSALIRDKGTLNCLGYTMEETFPASAKVVEATKAFGASEEPTQCGWNLAFNTELPLFQYLSNHAERAERFGETMKALTSTDGYHVRHLVNGYL